MAPVRRSFFVASSAVLYAGHALNGPLQLDTLEGQTDSGSSASTTGSASRYFKQKLTNYVDLQYWGDLDVGSQVVQGILDTGSYELLVCSEDSVGCGKAAVYEHSESTEEIGYYGFHFYGSGSTFSQIVTDTVAVTGAPASAGLSKTDQYLWEILRTYMPVITEGNFQAIVGLGPPEVPDEDARANAENVDYWSGYYGDLAEDSDLAQGLVSNTSAKADFLEEEPTLVESWNVKAFSVCLQRPYETPGYLFWNDEDTRISQSSLFSYVEVTGDRTWGATVTQVAVGGTSLGCGKSCGAIVDSGTSLLMVDPETWDNMYDYLLDQQASGNLAQDCSNLDQLPDLVFHMGNVEFRLPPQSYVGIAAGTVPEGLQSFFPNAEDGEYALCELLLAPIYSTTSSGPLWIVGMPFFREYYTMFDLGDNPRDPKSRAMYTSAVGDDCEPAHYEDVSMSIMVQEQRKVARRVDRSKVRIPAWALTANRTGHMRM